jgi:hypothetical protein
MVKFSRAKIGWFLVSRFIMCDIAQEASVNLPPPWLPCRGAAPARCQAGGTGTAPRRGSAGPGGSGTSSRWAARVSIAPPPGRPSPQAPPSGREGRSCGPCPARPPNRPTHSSRWDPNRWYEPTTLRYSITGGPSTQPWSCSRNRRNSRIARRRSSLPSPSSSSLRSAAARRLCHTEPRWFVIEMTRRDGRM